MLQSVQSLHSTVQYEHAQEIPKGRTNKIRGSEFSFCPFFPQEIHIFFLFSFVKQQHHVGYTLHALNYFGFYALLHSTIPGACFQFPMSALVTHVVGILQISEAISWMQQQIFNYMLAYL